MVKATASYEWFLKLVEPLASRCVLAHPGKLRVIADSTCKTDKIDAKILAEFLARDQVPQAYRPTPRERQHRVLARFRQWVKNKIVGVKCKLRHSWLITISISRAYLGEQVATI